MGYRGACERRSENNGVDGDMQDLADMPYTGNRLTAVTRQANEGE